MLVNLMSTTNPWSFPVSRSASTPIAANYGHIALPESTSHVPEVVEVTAGVAALHVQPPAAIVAELVADAERRAGLRLLTESRDSAAAAAEALYGQLWHSIPAPEDITAAATADAHLATLTRLVDRATANTNPAARWTDDLATYVRLTAGRITGLPPLPLSRFQVALQDHHDYHQAQGATPPRSTDADLAAEQAADAYNRNREGSANVPAMAQQSAAEVIAGHRHPLEALTFVDSWTHDSLPKFTAEHLAAVDLIAAADARRTELGL